MSHRWRLDIADISATVAQDDGEIISLEFLGPDRVVTCGLDGRITIFGPLRDGVVSSIRLPALPRRTVAEEDEDEEEKELVVSCFKVSCHGGKIIFATVLDGADEVELQIFDERALDLPVQPDGASSTATMSQEVLRQHRTLARLKGHEGAVNGVCLVAGMAITASDDTTVRLWNVLEALDDSLGQVVLPGLRHTIEHPKTVWDAGFFSGHDSALIFTSCADCFVRLYDMRKSQSSPTVCIAVTDSGWTSFAVSRGDQPLLAIAESTEVRVYDALRGPQPVARCELPAAVVRAYSVEFMSLPDMSLMCGCEDGTLLLVNLASNYAEGFNPQSDGHRSRGGISVLKGEPEKNYMAFAFARGTWGIAQLQEQEEEKDTLM